ncbi:hypothetical protein MPSEU_000302600 [Mayamaea pseudoterrestris]|nr:hypothetical protein MPSEU_000302600 [Mayamaea pseudoterrestris]
MSSSNISNEPAKDGSSSSSSSSIPTSPAELRASIKSLMHRTVVATNEILGSLEQTKRSVQTSPVVTNLQHVQQQTMEVASSTLARGKYVYQHRREYGPEIVMGTTIAAGSLATLRRGKLAGFIAGALGAGLAYVAVYEQQVSPGEALDILFGVDDSGKRK